MIDHLPELPFERILSYLRLWDLIRSRTVSRAWKTKVDNFKVKSLCYSTKPLRHVYQKKRLVSGVFAQNFISSSAFEAFFSTFGSSILSNLKHLRLCELTVSSGKLAKILSSFVRLEELHIAGLQTKVPIHLKVSLPMLNSIQLSDVLKIEKLTLDTPRLRKIKSTHCPWPLELVHGESVERLAIEDLSWIEVEKLKNLQYLFCSKVEIDFKFLQRLEQLKEISVVEKSNVRKLFEQKQQYGRADLKIYLYGLLCYSLADIEQTRSRYFFVHLAENPSRLADEIPIGNSIHYRVVERLAPGAENAVLSRSTDLSILHISEPVQDIERFLDFLKRSDRFVRLRLWCDQQELLKRLPEHCEIHSLAIRRELSDLSFVFRLKHLIRLRVHYSVDAETISKVFKELPSILLFHFKYNQKKVKIQNGSGEFTITVDGENTKVPDLSAAIEFLTAEPAAEAMEE